MNILSLFDGISSAQVALQRAGIKVDNYFASEIDKYAISITQKHFPNTIQVGDVTKLNKDSLPEIDLVCAGSPCQSLSYAGNLEGFDGKSGLFFEFSRLLKEINPKYFLLENVKTKQKWLDVISDNIGVKPIFIDSKDFSAQKRKRFYWTNIPVNEYSSCDKVLEDILQPETVTADCWLNQFQIDRGIKKNKAQTLKTGTKMGEVKFPTPRNEKSKCINTVRIKGDRTMTHIKDGEGIRLLSINEYEALQTLDKNYTEGIPLNQRYKVVGNGWTIDVISHIFSSLKNN